MGKFALFVRTLSLVLVLSMIQPYYSYAHECGSDCEGMDAVNRPGQLKTQCGAADLTSTDKNVDIGGILLAGIVMHVCGIGCGLFLAGQPSQFMVRPCNLGSIAVDIYTLASKAELAKQAKDTLNEEVDATTGKASDKNLGDKLHDLFAGNGVSVSTLTLDSISLFLDTAQIGYGIAQAMKPRHGFYTMEEMQDMGTNGEKVRTQGSVTDGALGETDTAGAKKANKLDGAMMCISSALAIASFGLTIKDVQIDASAISTACGNAHCLKGEPSAVPTCNLTSVEKPSPTRRSSWLSFFKRMAPNAYADEGESARKSDALDAKLQERSRYLKGLIPSDSTPDSLVRSYLTKERPIPAEFGTIGKIVNSMPYSATLVPLMDKYDFDAEGLDKIAREKPHAAFDHILESMPIPDELKGKYKTFYEHVQETPIPQVDAVSVAMGETTVEKAVAAATSATGGQRFGNKGEPADSGQTQYSADIWHVSWKDSIFQLISERIKMVEKRLFNK